MVHKKFYLSIGAIFKNESHILEEWINHHYHHGVEHFFLINDKSTDNYYEILKKYIDNGLVTLFNLDGPKESRSQEGAYNYFFSSTKLFTEWLAIIDLDEFIYSTLSIDLRNIIKIYDRYDQILIKAKEFGSSGLIEQPAEVVQNFIYRKSCKHSDPLMGGNEQETLNNPKCIVKADKVYSYWIHSCAVEGKSVLVDYDIIAFNHYKIQSYNYYVNVKLPRGDAFYSDNTERSIEKFKEQDYQDECDEFLKIQNQNLPPNALPSKEIFIKELMMDFNNFYEKQEYEATISLGSKLLSLDYQNINIIFIIGNSLLAKKQYIQAIYFYNLAINLDSNSTGAIVNRDYCLSKLRGEATGFYNNNPHQDVSKLLYLL